LTLRKRISRAFLLVAVAILALVMLALNAGVWYRESHMPEGRTMMGSGFQGGRGQGVMGAGSGAGAGPGTQYKLTLEASFLAGLVGIAVAVVVSIWVAERVTRPLRRLADSARTARPGAGAFPVHAEDDAEIRDLSKALTRMTERLQAEDAARRNLFADVAHELRHPVTLIRGKLEMILDGVEPMTPQSLSGLQDEVIRLGRLLGDLQDLSLAEVGVLSLKLGPVNLTAQLEMVQENFEPVAAGKPVSLAFDVAPLPTIVADADRVRQILANLLSNAIRHTPEGGSIRVAARTSDEQVEIAVTDSGPGVSAADLLHIFDRFYRSDKSRTRATGGAGLGLPIALSLARLHGGDILAENAEGGGARFRLTLPVPKAVPTAS